MSNMSLLVRLLAVLTTVTLLGGCATAVTLKSLASNSPAPAGTVPSAPAGWTTVFSDNFAGQAGAAPSLSNWFYDIGSGSKYAMGEVDRTTRSPANVFLDGGGHLVLKATRSGGKWTSGRIESTREDFAAPAGGELEMTASIKLPITANALGYWPAFWSVGSPRRTGGGWPVSGELDMVEDVNGLNAASQTMHEAAGSTGHELFACTTSRCGTGYHAYSVIVNRTNSAAEYVQFLMDGRSREKVTEAEVGATAWKKAIDHGFFILIDLAMGGTYPNVICQCTTPRAATTSGASMKLGYVAVYEKGGNSTPTARALATGQVKGLNGWCLDNRNSLDVTANVVDAVGCGASSGQKWSLYSNGTLRTEGGCLGFWGTRATNGAFVDWYPCNGTGNQAWTHKSNGELVNSKSGLCLTIPLGQRATQLNIQPCTDAATQHWTLP
jgi:beta-glucanase (GH16 family)